MSEWTANHFNLRWHTHPAYLISLSASHLGAIPPVVVPRLQALGMQLNGKYLCIQTGNDWKSDWDKIYAAIIAEGAGDMFDAAITTPHDALEDVERKPLSVVQALAESLWLGDALLEKRVVCYLQPVLDTRGQVFGYESFARVRMPDGAIVGGERIIAASRALNIEYLIDRHLHVQAITTFVSSAFSGFLFVNLFPGFILRPEVYLEGLSNTAKKLGIVPKHIVLDLTRAESPHDIRHLKSVCDYVRSRGMSIALDDIESLAGAQKLVPEIRPDFVKLDSKLTRKAADPEKQTIIRQIVALAHQHAGSVLAEGVETQEVQSHLSALGVDLYQGYLFSAPMPVEAVMSKVSL
jgi:EAL domain-containing protein (putative c-di-GMP-specific phosphodiesterase class I)